MELKKITINSQPLKPITASQSYEFILKNKDQFVSQFGIEKYVKTIEDYKAHLGIREKPTGSADSSS